MQADRLTPGGMMVRFFTALLLIYTTFNPEGISFFHWAVVPLIRGEGIGSIGPIKVVAGILLFIGWLVFLRVARRSLGVLGSLLVLALGGVAIWLLVDRQMLPATSARAVVHIGLVIISLLLAIGVSWSSIGARSAGQLDTDQVR